MWDHHHLLKAVDAIVTELCQTGTPGDSQCRQTGLSASKDSSFPGVSCATRDLCTCRGQQLGRHGGGTSPSCCRPGSLALQLKFRPLHWIQTLLSCVSCLCVSSFLLISVYKTRGSHQSPQRLLPGFSVAHPLPLTHSAGTVPPICSLVLHPPLHHCCGRGVVCVSLR